MRSIVAFYKQEAAHIRNGQNAPDSAIELQNLRV